MLFFFPYAGPVPWLVCLILIASSVGLALLAKDQTAGRAMPLMLVGMVAPFGAWRAFEAYLNWRFPTSTPHTRAGRNAAITLGVLLVLQALLVLLGR